LYLDLDLENQEKDHTRTHLGPDICAPYHLAPWHSCWHIAAMSKDATDKKEALQRMLDQGMVQLVLDPRGAEVQVPEAFCRIPLLRLNISQRFPDADLRVDWWGVRQTLTFPQGRFCCRIPWSAIFAMANTRHPETIAFWPDSVPAELQQLIGSTLSPRPAAHSPRQRAPVPPIPPAAEAPASPRRGFVPRLVTGTADDGEADGAPAWTAEDLHELQDEPEPPPPPPARGRPRLRLVK